MNKILFIDISFIDIMTFTDFTDNSVAYSMIKIDIN